MVNENESNTAIDVISKTLTTVNNLENQWINATNKDIITELSNIYTLDMKECINKIFEIEISDNIEKTIQIINIPKSENSVLSILIKIAYDNAANIIYPHGIIWNDDVTPSFITGKQYLIQLISYDDGDTWLANVVNTSTIDTIPINNYNITFNITNGTNPVEGATINILNQVLTTNSDGIATLTNINATNNISYSISKNGFITLDGTVSVINNDVIQNINLTVLPTYSVTFTVTDGTNVIQGALININNQTLTTDANGIATISGLNTGNNISYSANKTGYNTLSSTLNIVNQNISQNIILIASTSFNINNFNPKAVLSLAKINPNYNGACLNVRRSSDNTTQDIGYKNGYLDLEALTIFVGTSNGYVVKWYDSSCLGNDFVQTINTNQPRIVNNGLPEDGIWFSGSSLVYLELQPNTSINNLDKISIISQFKPISKNAGTIFTLISKSPNGYYANFYDTISALYFGASYTSSSTSVYRPNTINLSQWNNMAITLDKTNALNYPKMYADGIVKGAVGSVGSGTIADDSASPIQIGKNLQGNIKSMILCNSILSNADIINEMTTINSFVPKTLTSTVVFTVTDGTNPIQGVSVTFNNATMQTDSSGIATFNNIMWALNMSYTISKTGYYNITGTINVNSENVTKSISMVIIPTEFNVVFTVSDGVNKVDGANILFNNQTLVTDSTGKVTFPNVHVGNNLPYTITKPNYRNTTGTINIVDSVVNVNVILSTLTIVSANVFYVSLTGNDTNDGLTPDTPFQTIAKAQNEAKKKSASGMTQDFYIYLRQGEYQLTTAWNFDKTHSSSNGHKIIYKSYTGERAVITCSKTWSGWTQYDVSKNIWSIDTPSDYPYRQIFYKDKLMKPARYPNVGYNKVAFLVAGHTSTQFGFNDGDIPIMTDTSNLEVFIWPGGDTGNIAWTANTIKVTNIDYTNHIVTLANATTYSMGAGSRYIIQKSKDLLDTPGEYHIDTTNHKLYVIPEDTFNEADFRMPNFYGFMNINGGSGGVDSVKGIQFEELTIENINGGIFVLHSENINFINNIIRNFVNTAIYNQENKNCIITGNHIYNIGGDAVVINGLALSSLHSSSGNIVDNNEIHDYGLIAGAATGVNLDQADDAFCRHNRIYNSNRWGISFGGRKVGELISKTIDGIIVTSENVNDFRHGVNNLIENNDVSNCNMDSEDTSPIYTYGCGADNIIRYNAIHDSGVPFNSGYGVYFDDGADGSLVDSNVIYNMQLQEGGDFRGFIIKGIGNTVKNNIIADSNSQGALVPSSSTDTVGNIKFYNNIITNSGNIMYDMYGATSIVTESNLNTFYSPDNQYLVYRNAAKNIEDLRLGTYTGTFDQNSIEENPKFINAYSNDYRLRYDSPTRALGNVDIDFGSIGLTSSYMYSELTDTIDKVFVTSSKAGFSPNINLDISEQLNLSVYARTLKGYYDNLSNATITVISDKPSVASVSGQQITGVSKGVTEITITVTKNNITKSTKIYILVSDVFKTVSILTPYSRFTASWNGTKKLQLLPIMRTELGRIIGSSEVNSITYNSSDETKLTVDTNGLCNVLDNGDVTVTVTVVVDGVQKSGSIIIKALKDDLFDGVNLLQGGDMEIDSSAWSILNLGGASGVKSYDNTTFDTGTRSMKVVVSDVAVNSPQNYVDLKHSGIGFINKVPYRLAISHKSLPDLQYWIYVPAGLSTAPSTTSNWQKWYIDWISTVDNANTTLELFLGRNNGTFWIDNIGLYRKNIYRCPEIPTNIIVKDNGNSLDISWSVGTVSSLVNTSIQGYNIYLNGVKVNTNLITDVNYIATVADNLNYDVQMTTVDNEGNESFKTSSISIKRL